MYNVVDEGGQAPTAGDPATVYVVFSPEQVKSATDNVGMFDVENPDIRFMRQNNKPVDWEGIQKGDGLNTVKSILSKNKVDKFLPQEPIHDNSIDIVKRVEAFLVKHGIVNAVDKRRVNLASPDDFMGKGYPPSVEQRARHITSKHIDKRDRAVRVFDSERVPFVWAVPRTLADADIVVEGMYKNQSQIYYFKNYKVGNGQKTHLVVTDKRGRVLEQGNADYLITQFSVDLRKKHFNDSFTVTYKKGGLNIDPHKPLLIPTTATLSPRPDHSSSEPTVALSNPAGVASSEAQTRGVSRSEADINNIRDSSEKSKKKINFFSGDYSPAPIPPKAFNRLLEQLGKTGLAKGVSDCGLCCPCPLRDDVNSSILRGPRAKPKTKAAASAVKPVKKRSTVSASAAKPAKKRSKVLTAAKPAKGASEPEFKVVPLAEVEILAAKAEKRIKSQKKLSAAEKTERLESLAGTLARARGWGGLSGLGAWGVANIHEPVRPYDKRAVLR